MNIKVFYYALFIDLSALRLPHISSEGLATTSILIFCPFNLLVINLLISGLASGFCIIAFMFSHIPLLH
jgi:hypothetical protein